MLANPPFGVEWKKVKEAVEDEAELGHARPLRRRPAADQRRLVPVPAAHAAARWCRSRRAAPGSRSSSTARRCSPVPPSRASRRSGRWILENDCLEGIVAPARPALLQHRHLHLLLDPVQPQAARAQGQGRPARRPRPVGEDAQVASATSASRSASRRSTTSPSVYADALDIAADPEHADHAQGEGLPHPRLRLPPHHRRAPAQAALRDHRRHPRRAGERPARWPSGTAATSWSSALRPLHGSTWWTKREAADALRGRRRRRGRALADARRRW